MRVQLVEADRKSVEEIEERLYRAEGIHDGEDERREKFRGRRSAPWLVCKYIGYTQRASILS